MKATYTDTEDGGKAIDTIEAIKVYSVLEGSRVLLKDRQPGLSYYEMRHGETDWTQPISIELGVVVNFWGTLILPKPLPLTAHPSSFIELTPEQSEGFMWKAQLQPENEGRAA